MPMSKSHTGHTCDVVNVAASLTVLCRHVEYVFAKFRSFAVWCLRAAELGLIKVTPEALGSCLPKKL